MSWATRRIDTAGSLALACDSNVQGRAREQWPLRRGKPLAHLVQERPGAHAAPLQFLRRGLARLRNLPLFLVADDGGGANLVETTGGGVGFLLCALLLK